MKIIKPKVALLTEITGGLEQTLHDYGALTLVIGIEPHNKRKSIRNPKDLPLIIKKFLKNKTQNKRSLIDFCKKHELTYVSFPYREQSILAEKLKEKEIDILITYAAPLLESSVLSSPLCDAINLHHSILPNYKGGNPIFWQILHGQIESGVTIHRLSEKIDDGEILYQEPFDFPAFTSKNDIIENFHSRSRHGIIKLLNTFIPGEPLNKISPSTGNTNKKFYARNVRRKELQDIIEWEFIEPDQLLNLVRYLGEWPIDIATPPGLLSFLPYKAEKIVTSNSPNTLQGLTASGMSLTYGTKKGVITLKPSFNPIAIIKYIRKRQRILKGKLNSQYI